ncbi:hypothetical protein GQ53DRAFT_855518 [Thozetella sp. PMI_491]|nr:hypothetical protein GQ53DRAFT_855518 [Thozetella sp. PMI_491]
MHYRKRCAKLLAVLSLLLFWGAYIRSSQGLLPSKWPPSSGFAKAASLHWNSNPRSRVAKVTVAANALGGTTIHRAIKSHHVQNLIHGYKHYLAGKEAVGELVEHDRYNRPAGAWTKPAYLLSIIVTELQKEENQRLEWVFWFDADTVVLNPYTPLELFTPPKSDRDLEDIHLLISSNWDGLNSGVFALRVHTWSVSLLSAVLAYPIYEAERQKEDRFRDQSAFQFLLQNPGSPLASLSTRRREHWIEVPIRWFNSFPFNDPIVDGRAWIYATNITDETFDNGTMNVYGGGSEKKVNTWKVMQGDMAVHFAGATAAAKGIRDSWMGRWLERAEGLQPQWANKTSRFQLKKEADSFWASAVQGLSGSGSQ